MIVNAPQDADGDKRTSIKVSPVSLGYFMLILFGVAVLAGLQYQYWNGEFGYHEFAKLNDELIKQKRINANQQAINNALRADIRDLKSGLGAIEEHARLDLGLIKSGETFVELSVAPIVSERELAVGVDSSQATESVDGLLDGTGVNVDTGANGDTGEN